MSLRKLIADIDAIPAEWLGPANFYTSGNCYCPLSYLAVMKCGVDPVSVVEVQREVVADYVLMAPLCNHYDVEEWRLWEVIAGYDTGTSSGRRDVPWLFRAGVRAYQRRIAFLDAW